MIPGDIRDYPVNRSKYIFHRDIGFPNSVSFLNDFYQLTYSKHALERHKGKYKSYKLLPSMIKITPTNTIEVHTDDKIIPKKVLVRTSYDSKFDIVMALQPVGSQAKVITFWINRKGDTHKELNKAKYTQP